MSDGLEKKLTTKTTRKPNMVTDPRLGARRADATHWRCFRLGDGEKKSVPLSWGEDRFQDCEWPIKACSAETILERWGAGRYVVQYLMLDDKGLRRPIGRSRVLQILPPAPEKPAEQAAPPPAPVPAPTPAATLAAPMPNGVSAAALSDASFQNLFSLLAYLEERAEKARAAAALENKAAQDRYRADLEFQLERERMASKERIAQIEAHGRATHVRGASFDAEALAMRFGEVVSERMQEALEEFTENEPPPPAPAATDSTTALVTALRETLMPILSIVATRFGPTPPPLPTPPPQGNGNGNDDDDGNDPEGKPN